MTDVLRMSAFPLPGADAAEAGNPAGVVLDAAGMDDASMLAVAAEVGYSETAFVLGTDLGDGAVRRVRIRYFSPIAEVPFCGHATIATAVALASRDGAGPLVFETLVGEVPISTDDGVDGGVWAAFTSVEPRVEALDESVLDRLLALLGVSRSDLDPAPPPRAAFAGNVHPVIVLAERAVFDGFVFDPAAVRALMDEQGWAGTVTVLHPSGGARYEARNLFPVGAITEDPATGSAAASTGAYLRDRGLVDPPAEVQILQGAHVGRPSLLQVTIPAAGGVVVRGSAAVLD